MKKPGIVILVLFGIVWIGALIWAFSLIPSMFRGFASGSALSFDSIQVPKAEPPVNAVVVLNFKPQGDADAKFYSVGFARALADRLYCAPNCVTQQIGINELSGKILAMGQDSRKPISDNLVQEIGKELAVRYAVSGDLVLTGNTVNITAHVIGITDSSNKTIKVSGSLADLPSLQRQLVSDIVKTLNLRPSAEQAKELAKPNFTNPKTLYLYGQSYLVKDYAETESLRWKMVQGDPQSIFPVLRLLEYYYYGPSTTPEIAANARLQSLIAGSLHRYPENSHLYVLNGLLLNKQFKYSSAESALKDVISRDPNIVKAHSALAGNALCREDGMLAVAESKRALEMWPNSSNFHALLASAYSQAASNARHGHYSGNMSYSVSRTWKQNSEECYREAVIAVKINRDCSEGWCNLLSVARELGFYKDVDRAFYELTRIDPKNMGAYTDYAFCFSPQWGGTSTKQEQILQMADQAFGQGSPESCVVRAQTLMSNVNSSDPQRDYQRILNYADLALQKSKEPRSDAMMLKCKALVGLKRRGEMLPIAEKAYQKWGSLNWTLRLNKAYAFKYEDQRDFNALKRAEELARVYVQEIPYDAYGYIEWGWCLSHLGRRAEAKQKFLKALELDPANELAKEKLQYVQ